jgi:hypothetical protein
MLSVVTFFAVKFKKKLNNFSCASKHETAARLFPFFIKPHDIPN